MRIVYGILFLCGFFFAAFAWICLFLPFGALFPTYRYGIRDIVISVSAAGLALGGYLVWFGWGRFAIQGKWSPVDSGRLALLSLMVHGGWLVLLPWIRHESFAQMASTGWPLFAWLNGNLTISICVLIAYVESEPVEELAETNLRKP